MSDDDFESTLRERMSSTIDPMVPGPSATHRVMEGVLGAAAGDRGEHAASRMGRGLGTVLVASAVVLLVGGALGVSLALRNQVVSPGPSSHTTPPAPLPTATQTPPSVAPTPSPSAGIAACDGADLSARFADQDGAAGTLGGDIVLRNTGTSPCTMDGYANLQGYAGGHVTQLGVTHSIGGTLLNNNNGTLPTVASITLQPGQQAYVAVEYSDVQSTSTVCPSFTTLLITPPQGQHAVRMDAAGVTFMLCGAHGAAIWIDEAPVSLTAYFAHHS
jgi:Protein of unknown function (DUF4232)